VRADSTSPDRARRAKSVQDAGALLQQIVNDPQHIAEPRHIRLRSAVVEVIAKGVWAPGDKLPPEGDLARAAGVSLGTAQKALTNLAREGLLVRRHGHGTFVAGDASQSAQLMHFRFINDDGSAIVPVYAEAIERKVISRPGPWSEFLPQAHSFIRIRRRINVSDEFDCLSELYIDAVRFKSILDMPMQELHRVVIRNVLARRFNAPTFSITQRIYATIFAKRVADILHLPDDKRFGLVLEIRSSSHHQAPLAFQNVFVPPDVRKLEIPAFRMIK
jgi:GntR family transcriptional regulator